MINKTIMTAGAFILSMMVLIAATNIDSVEVSEQDRDHHTLSGIVVDADTEEAIPNATVYIKKKNGDDRMQADRTQQQDHQQQQQQRDRAAGHDQEGLEQTTTDQNGEFEFDNIEQLLAQGTHGAQQQQQQQQQQQHEERDDEDVTFVLVVEAEGYETEEKEIKLSDYIERDDSDRGVTERDQDRDRDYDRDMDRDRDDDKDKDKDKIKIELTRSN